MSFDRSAYLDAFREESEEHLQRLGGGLLELEQRADDPDAVASLFRSAHTIKGGARMMGYAEIGDLANAVEDVLDGLRRGQLAPSRAMVDAMLAAVDGLQEQLATLIREGAARPADPGLLDRLQRLARGESPPAAGPAAPSVEPSPAAEPTAPAPPPTPPPPVPPVEVSDTATGAITAGPASEPLPLPRGTDGASLAAELLPAVRPPSRGETEPAPARPPPLAPAPKGPGPAAPAAPAVLSTGAIATADAAARSVRVSVDKLDRVLNLAGELLVHQRDVRQRIQETRELWGLVESYDRAVAAGDTGTAAAEWTALRAAISQWQRAAVRADERATELAEELHYEVGRLRMFPLSSLFGAFPRAVRDMAREQDKEVRLVVEGELTEVDKQILEALRDPLLHLVRNAVDHGIETPAEREARGKPRQATIALRGHPHGSQVVVEVEDDGAGIDVEIVRGRAVERGLLTWAAAQALDDDEVRQLIFRPGFSTRRQAGATSGRGVGLDVVKSQVEQLKGEVSLRSTLGQGTCFSLRVPLSLALLRVLLMRASGQHFALPLSAVEGVVSVTWSELEAVQGQPALDWGEQLLPVASLAQALQLPGPASEPAVEPAVVVGASGRSFAIVVDAIVGEENIVAKPVPPLLGRIQAVSAAAPLSESEMAIVLHPQELLERARQSGPVEPAAHRETGPHRILVVDDSVATRELERSILQAAGYIVETAVDGLDAWRRLADEPFDLVVADVEMPGLDGFALTERLRAAPRFEGLPVVIVSARSSDEDRRRGLEAGAQAYIVKSAFDQTNLLDTVERLLR